jgi:hypothetical protein
LKPRRLRTAGSRWRILVHERIPGERMSGRAFDITSDPRAIERHAETMRRLNEMRPDLPPSPDTTVVTVLPGTEFDELVIGKFLHLEMMDTNLWWCSIGGVVLNIRADRDGNPKQVDVFGPGTYDDPVPGCEYSCAWIGGTDG